MIEQTLSLALRFDQQSVSLLTRNDGRRVAIELLVIRDQELDSLLDVFNLLLELVGMLDVSQNWHEFVS